MLRCTALHFPGHGFRRLTPRSVSMQLWRSTSQISQYALSISDLVVPYSLSFSALRRRRARSICTTHHYSYLLHVLQLHWRCGHIRRPSSLRRDTLGSLKGACLSSSPVWPASSFRIPRQHGYMSLCRRACQGRARVCMPFNMSPPPSS